MVVVPTGDGEWRLTKNVGGRGQKKSPSASPDSRGNRSEFTGSASVSSSASVPLANHADWQTLLDSGVHNGKPGYIHYTSKAGAEAIAQERAISDAARGETRAGSKGGVYINTPGQQFNSENVATYCF